jgi:hypothetical protein
MTDAQTRVRKSKKDDGEVAVAEVKAPEVKPEPRRRQFKSLGELLEYYEGVKALRLDGKVHSANLEAFAVPDPANPEAHLQVWLKVNAAKDPASGQTVPAGEYRLLDVGIVTFCRRLGMSYTYFNKYPRRQEIVEHMNVLNKANEKDYVLRLLKDGDSYVIQAVLPKAFVPIDHADVLRAVVESSKNLGEDAVLEAFYEGPFDRAIDVVDIRLPGNVSSGGKTFRPVLRVMNSEVDMSALFFAVGAGATKDGVYVSLARNRGAVRVTHRGKSGDIKDWLNIPELVKQAQPVADSVMAVAEKPVHKARTTDFLVHKLGVVGTDVEAFLTDYFVTRPAPETLGAYVLGMAEASRAFPVSKMQKMCDLAITLVHGDIPVVTP